FEMYTTQRKILIAVLLLAAVLPSKGAPDPYGRLTYFDEIDDLINELENANYATIATTQHPKAFIDKETSTTSKATGRDQHVTPNTAIGDADHSQQPAVNSTMGPSAAVDYSRSSGSPKQKERYENPEATEQNPQVNQVHTMQTAANLVPQKINDSAKSLETTSYSIASTELPEQQFTTSKNDEKETARTKQPSFESPAVPTTIKELPTGPAPLVEETSQYPKGTEQQEITHIHTTEKATEQQKITHIDMTEKAAHPASQDVNDSVKPPETTSYSVASTELSEQQFTLSKDVQKGTARPKQPSFESPAVLTTIKELPTRPAPLVEETSQYPKGTEQQEITHIHTTEKATEQQKITHIDMTEKAAHPASQDVNDSAKPLETTSYSVASTKLPEQQSTTSKDVEKETARPKQPSFESPAVPTTIKELPTGPAPLVEETSQYPKGTEQQEITHIDTTEKATEQQKITHIDMTEKAAHPASQDVNDSAKSPETTTFPTASEVLKTEGSHKTSKLPQQRYTITNYVENETAQPQQPTSKSRAVPVTLNEYPSSSEKESPDRRQTIEKYQELTYVYTTTEAAFAELRENNDSTQSSETTGYAAVPERLKPNQTSKILEQAGNLQNTTFVNVTTGDLQEQDFYSTFEAAVRPIHKKCSCDIKKVWIDLVFVIDVSRAVSLQDFFAIGNLLAYYFRQMPISQEPGHYVRVGIVFCAERAFTAARLSSFANSNEAVNAVRRMFRQRSMLPVGRGHRFNVNAALNELWRTLEGESKRNKPVAVVLFSASEVKCDHHYAHQNSPQMRNADPCRTAAGLMEGNNVLITIALKFGGLKRFPRINLGDPCFSLVNDINLPKILLGKICEANCFCLHPFVQYRREYGCTRYAECIYLHGIPLTYRTAVDTCKQQSATLVDIFDKYKEQFIAELHRQGQYAPYWIGLKKENGQRVWPTGVKLRNGHYTKWDNGQPRKGGNCTIVKQRIDGVTHWASQRCDSSRSYFFSCQRPACDTNSYYDYF
uniref:Ovule protein n=1 Tax=Parascaris univalens TaxID=6257 RepID=A0A915B108_PARUN